MSVDHFVWWVKKPLGDVASSISDMSTFPGQLSSSFWHAVPQYNVSWNSPPLGTIKIIVDSSFSYASNQSGIEGLFRDFQDNSLLHYEKQVMANSTIHTKILTIKEGLLVVGVSRWTISTSFTLKFDSSNVILWFSQLAKAPWQFQNLARESLFHFFRGLHCLSTTSVV